MNRTDRLYALVEELRAFAPRTRTAKQLAERFEVSIRTIERDLNALLQAGVPIYATAGRGGGYAIDKTRTLPPINFTPQEATALAIALARPGDSPLAGALRSAVRKVIGAMPAADADAARQLASRIHLFPHKSDDRPPMASTIEEAVLESQVLRIGYEDRHGRTTQREVEPIALVGSGDATWYLVGYCRLRQDQRAFRLDRVTAAELTGEPAADRERPTFDDIPAALRDVSLLD